MTTAPKEPRLWFEGMGDRLLFLHGWGLSPTAHAPSLRHLARRGFAVAAPQLAVVGRHWSASSAVARARSTLDRLGWERAVVVGNSLGGAVALLLAAAEPQRVRRLVLVDSVAVPLDRSLLEIAADRAAGVRSAQWWCGGSATASSPFRWQKPWPPASTPTFTSWPTPTTTGR